MTNTGTIILIEDDKDDVEIISNILSDSFPNHQLKNFDKLETGFDFLNGEKVKPFIIICDTNWRNKNQKKLRQLLGKYPDLKLTSIPFIFYASSPQDHLINEAFANLNVQGYFQKGNSYEEIKKDLNSIITYWERSLAPVKPAY